MNNNRRKQLSEILERVSVIKEEIESIANEEQEYLDNMPEAFSDGEKGDKSRDAIEALEAATSSVNEVEDYIQNSIDA